MPTRSGIDDPLTHSVIGAFFEVYNTLGYGFLERVYKKALERELRARGLKVEREVRRRVYYKSDPLDDQRIDMLVNDRLIVEVKATFELQKIAPRQLYNYLRAMDLELGLLLHFGPEPGFRRIVNRRRR